MKMPNKHSAPRGRATLRMLDGGPAPAAAPAAAPAVPGVSPLPGAAATPPPPPGMGQAGRDISPAAQLANMQKLNGASSPTATPPVVPGATPGTPAAPLRDAAWGVKMGMATSLLNSFNPLPIPMKHGGQVMAAPQHGGEVPGQGRGDKVHALLEPDEIVVSNAMQKKMPGLRDSLMDLREQTLADQGMTVAEADAKARSGGTLRAQTGFDGFDPQHYLKKNFPGGAGDLDLTPQQRGVAMYTQPGVPAVAPEMADPRLTRLPPGHGLASAADTLAAGDEGNTMRVDRNGTVTRPGFQPQLSGPAAAPSPTQTPGLPGTSPTLRLSNEPLYNPAPLAPDRMTVEQMNAPGVASRAAAAAANAPSSEGLGNPRMDQLAREAEILKARLSGGVAVPPGPRRGSPIEFESPALKPKPVVAPVEKPAPTTRTGKLLAKLPGVPKVDLRSAAAAAQPYVVPGAAVLAAVPGQLDVAEVASDPLYSKADVASQQGSSVGRYVSQAAGMALGGTLGTMAAPGVGTAVGGIAGGLYGGMAYDKFERGAKQLAGLDGTTPLERKRLREVPYAGKGGSGQTSAEFAAVDPRRVSFGGRGEGYDDPRRLDMDPSRQSLGASRDLTNDLNSRPNGKLPDINGITGLRDNVVYKTVDKQGRVTYSGRNVGVNKDGETRMVDGKGADLKMLNGNNPNFVRDDQTGATAYGNSQGQVYSGDGTIKSGPAGDPIRNALRAAAERGDTAALEGFYAARGEGFGGKSAAQIMAEREEAGAPRRGEFGFNAYTRNKLALRQDETQRRSQDTQLEVAMAPAKLAAANRDIVTKVLRHESIGGDPAKAAAALIQAGRPDLAEGLQKSVTTMQDQAGKTQALSKATWDDMRDQFKGKYLNPDKDGNPENNKALEERAYARLKRTNPEAFRLGEVDRAKAIQRAIAEEELMQAFGNPDSHGYASLAPDWLSGNRLMDRTNDLPGAKDLRGAQLSDRVGGFRGAISPFMEKGDYTLNTAAGNQDINMGKLSGDAINRLKELLAEANK